MSLPPSYPPPPPGSFSADPRPPSNGLAVAALVLGILTLPLAVVPLVSLLALLTALIGIGLGLAGVRRGRRVQRGTTMAGWGLGLSGVGLVVAAIMTFVFIRWLGDALDWVGPPEPSEKVGQWFETDDGDLRIKVTSVECGTGAGADDLDTDRCTFTFEAKNQSDTTITLDGIRVKAVLDDATWDHPSLDGDLTLDAGRSGTITGSTVLGPGQELTGLAFDADDASSHSAVVVDPGLGQ